MKASFILSATVATMLPKGSLDKVVQACEAERNRRAVVKSTESGVRNSKKENLAKSSATIAYEQSANVVTAFMEFSESEVGAVDKAQAKLRKLLGEHVEIGGTLEFPATFRGQDIAAWVAKLTAKEAKPSGKGIPAPAVNTPVPTVNA